ncbi:MAG TPA: divergent polysaccharide deacetylase family protein [Candidatus Binatia bacterium]|nr:divergent polysaccharide deacetylase family protein [Candidatus Binatia bacterium]
MKLPVVTFATLAVAGCAHAPPDSAPPPGAAESPRIAIVVDDLGDQLAPARRVLALPGPVACAFLPGSPHTGALAQQAHALGKEVLVHLPLQPRAVQARPVGLSAGSTALDVDAYLAASLEAVPHASGVNNHQGSLLTTQRQPMDWLMAAMARRGGLYFLDSRTAAHSVAYDRALANGLRATARDVFLDADPDPRAIRAAFGALVRRAHRHGQAVAIAHPYPATLQVLEELLPHLDGAAVHLVPPSALTRTAAAPGLKLKLSPSRGGARARAPSLPAARSAAAR